MSTVPPEFESWSPARKNRYFADEMRKLQKPGESEGASSKKRGASEEIINLIDAAEILRTNSSSERRVTVGGVSKILVSPDDLQSCFALYAPRGGSSVWIVRDGSSPASDADLKRRLSGKVVKIGEDRDGRPQYRSAYSYITNTPPHIFKKLAFTGDGVSDDTLNLYSGLGVLPRPGRCEKILNHLFEVICCENEADFNALISLLAWQLQHIGQPSRIILLLRSERQQVGKGIFGELMVSLYGSSGFSAASIDQVLGRFNDSSRGRAFIFLDEALFGGDLRAADAIKQRSTAQCIGVETKGIPVVQMPIALNFLIASNHSCAAHVEEFDERYWILEVSEKRCGDHTYFAALCEKIDNRGREAFLDYLLKFDTTSFVPQRDVPRDNGARRRMVHESLNPFAAEIWLEECARAEQLLGAKALDGSNWKDWPDDGGTWKFSDFVNAYAAWKANVRAPVAARPTPISELGSVLRKAGIRQKLRHGAGRLYVLPEPAECLAALFREGDGGDD